MPPEGRGLSFEQRTGRRAGVGHEQERRALPRGKQFEHLVNHASLLDRDDLAGEVVHAGRVLGAPRVEEKGLIQSPKLGEIVVALGPLVRVRK